MISGLTYKFLGALFRSKGLAVSEAQGIFLYHLHPTTLSCTAPHAVAIGTHVGFSM